MPVDVSVEVATTVSRAFAGGIETSIEELAIVLDVSGLGRLVGASRVVDFVEKFNLELVPSPSEAEYATPRVLRAATSTLVSPLARVEFLAGCGEGNVIEFKSSMYCSMDDWNKDGTLVEHPSLVGAVLKTVCGFLNSDGGDLLVGVGDDGLPCMGVSKDLEVKNWNLDKWHLNFQNLVRGRFYEGLQVQPYLRTNFVEWGSLAVFHVAVMPRTTRNFVKLDASKPFEFFLRNGPRTDSLDLPAFYAHTSRVSSPGVRHL